MSGSRVHCSPSKYHSCSVQTVGLGEGIRVGDIGVDSVVIVGFGVGQVGEVPHDGMIVGDEGVDSVVIEGSGVDSRVVGVGVPGSGVVGTTMLGSAVVGLVAVGSYVVSSGTGVGDSGEGLGVAMHTSQYIHSPLSNWAYSQHSVRVSKNFIIRFEENFRIIISVRALLQFIENHYVPFASLTGCAGRTWQCVDFGLVRGDRAGFFDGRFCWFRRRFVCVLH